MATFRLPDQTIQEHGGQRIFWVSSNRWVERLVGAWMTFKIAVYWCLWMFYTTRVSGNEWCLPNTYCTCQSSEIEIQQISQFPTRLLIYSQADSSKEHSAVWCYIWDSTGRGLVALSAVYSWDLRSGYLCIQSDSHIFLTSKLGIDLFDPSFWRGRDCVLDGEASVGQDGCIYRSYDCVIQTYVLRYRGME